MYKLQIEMIPRTSWYSNLRSELSKEDWDILRKEAYRNANWHCQICGCSGVQLHAHEIWDFNMATEVQTLIKIVALCPICHATIHYGRTCKIEGMAGAEKVMKHFCKVNNCSLEDFNEHVREAKDLWMIRSEVNWKLDISKITDRGIIPLKMKGDIK